MQSAVVRKPELASTATGPKVRTLLLVPRWIGKAAALETPQSAINPVSDSPD